VIHYRAAVGMQKQLRARGQAKFSASTPRSALELPSSLLSSCSKTAEQKSAWHISHSFIGKAEKKRKKKIGRRNKEDLEVSCSLSISLSSSPRFFPPFSTRYTAAQRKINDLMSFQRENEK
jgi:hypothetical protein